MKFRVIVLPLLNLSPHPPVHQHNCRRQPLSLYLSSLPLPSSSPSPSSPPPPPVHHHDCCRHQCHSIPRNVQHSIALGHRGRRGIARGGYEGGEGEAVRGAGGRRGCKGGGGAARREQSEGL